MSLEENYLEYVGELSISLLTVSAVYLIDLSDPSTFLALLMVPVLFGYTAYISRDGFRNSSLLSSVALFFAAINPLFAAAAIAVVSGNVLVSFFASGKSFRDFYGATTLPLLLTGLVLGAAAYGAATTRPGIADTIRDEGSTLLGEKAETAVEQSNIIEKQKQAQVSVMETASRTTVKATRAYVINETRDQFNRQELAALDTAFRNAEEEIPNRLSERADSKVQNASVDVSSKTKDLVGSTLQGKAFLLLIPIVTFGLYSLQPIIGLLTAVAGTGFRIAAERAGPAS